MLPKATNPVHILAFVPGNHHGNTACQPDHNQPDHVSWLVLQESDRQREHQNRSDDPVLQQGNPEDALVTKAFRHLLVAHLSKGLVAILRNLGTLGRLQAQIH